MIKCYNCNRDIEHSYSLYPSSKLIRKDIHHCGICNIVIEVKVLMDKLDIQEEIKSNV